MSVPHGLVQKGAAIWVSVKSAIIAHLRPFVHPLSAIYADQESLPRSLRHVALYQAAGARPLYLASAVGRAVSITLARLGYMLSRMRTCKLLSAQGLPISGLGLHQGRLLGSMRRSASQPPSLNAKKGYHKIIDTFPNLPRWLSANVRG